MSGRTHSNALSLFHVYGLCALFLFTSCQKSETAPSVGSTPKGKTEPVVETSDSDEDDSDETRSPSTSENKDAGNNNKAPENNTNNPNTPTPQAGPLPEAKQAELKTLFAGEWTSACLKIENPDVAGQFFSATESWKLTADGSIEVTYHDFDDADCKMPSPGFESYVFVISKPVAVKELAAKHFYVEMNVTKELDDNGVLADASDKFLIMVKFDANSMIVDFTEDMTATAPSAEAMTFTKK